MKFYNIDYVNAIEKNEKVLEEIREKYKRVCPHCRKNLEYLGHYWEDREVFSFEVSCDCGSKEYWCDYGYPRSKEVEDIILEFLDEV